MAAKRIPTRRCAVKGMSPAEFIRRHFLRMSTEEVATALGVTQSIISRYQFFPKAHRAIVDKMALERTGVAIKPSWHEKVPFDKSVPTIE